MPTVLCQACLSAHFIQGKNKFINKKKKISVNHSNNPIILSLSISMSISLYCFVEAATKAHNISHITTKKVPPIQRDLFFHFLFFLVFLIPFLNASTFVAL
jgi:accessory gene regulator protein AgrB